MLSPGCNLVLKFAFSIKSLKKSYGNAFFNQNISKNYKYFKIHKLSANREDFFS